MFGIHEDGTYRVENIGASRVELTQGYVVGIRAVTREADLPTLGTLFGRWTDPETGTVYWDEVEVYPAGEYESAMYAASLRGELAIWDVASDQAVTVGDTWAAVVRGDMHA